MPKLYSTNQIIHKFISVHNKKYCYILVKYLSSKNPVKIICFKHGIFTQRPNDHLMGHGCPKCKNDKKTGNISLFIKKSNIVYNNFYDYSKFVYVNSYTKGYVICPQHGKFLIKPNDHLSGCGCKKCSFKKRSNNRPENTEWFISKSNNVHNHKYSYLNSVYIKTDIKLEIECHTHGTFLQTPHIHLSGKGCPKCNSSKGEKLVEQHLKEHNILYETQKRFNGCRNLLPLSFDFYLPEHNACIEYDGRQHYKLIKYFDNKDTFLKRQKRDKIKNMFCKKSNIKLIRISYLEKENIDKILKSHLIKPIFSCQ